jgi:aminoglycoside phosphotransferase (APT) family kinase protein
MTDTAASSAASRAVDLDACLPAHLRGAATTITRIAGGLSGAGVYRVEAGGEAFVLKIAAPDKVLAGWRSKLHILRAAADAGLAPRIVHVDEARRAVVSEFVAGGTFFTSYANPRTRDEAIGLLGRTLRRIHQLPPPPDADPAQPREFLAATWAALHPDLVVPDFVADAVQRVLAEPEPAPERAPVLSHNDVHPANFIFESDRLLLLDWDTAGLNDPFYDLATVSLFLRMDPETCATLLAAYDGEPVTELPARFVYIRRLVGVLCGTNLLNVARQSGHPGATGDETLDSTPSLGDFYQRMRAGEVSIGTAEGQWSFGLALLKESIAP